MLNRRRLGRAAAAAGGGLLLAGRWGLGLRTALAYESPTVLKKYQQNLRGVGPGGIPVAAPDSFPAPVTSVTHYTININQYQDQLYPPDAGFGPTTLWGYNPAVALGGGVQPQRHLGGIIIAQKGVPVQLTFRNNLPGAHILPVDTTLMGADGPPNRVSTHLHGGFVPWISDGGPFATWDPTGLRGPSFKNNQVLNPGAAANEAEFYYPNQQSARLLWYHDHAVGITRLNAYAGIASAYIIRDTFEGNLRSQGLPDFVENGGREIPIVIQDKIFVGATIQASDPTWTGPTAPGSLWYPHAYDPADLGGKPSKPLPAVSCVPEMFGDTMLANGTIYPKVSIEPRRYRLRILNACQSRFLNLQLRVAGGNGVVPTSAGGPDFLVLGTEGGFLAKPARVRSNIPIAQGGSLLTAPAERWDLLIDFKDYAGRQLILYNDAPSPFPDGDPPESNDTDPEAAPDTRQIMRFDVGLSATGAADPALAIDENTDLTPGLDPFIVPPALLSAKFGGASALLQNGVAKLPAGIPVRQLTLNEDFDAYGRLLQLLGTNTSTGRTADGSAPFFGRAYDSTATETPKKGATEIWQIANLTGDTHPVHFHLVNVQVLARQPFSVKTYKGTAHATGPARGPEPTELGWKETVQMHPGEVTTVVMRFDLPTVPFTVPLSTRTELGVSGHEYVWHCHILEHEEHDMMRPLVVI